MLIDELYDSSSEDEDIICYAQRHVKGYPLY